MTTACGQIGSTLRVSRGGAAARGSLITLVASILVVFSAIRAFAVPLPSASVGEWWFAKYEVSKIWSLGAQGQGITVAVLDSGVNASRPELSGRVLPGISVTTGNGDGRTDTDTDRAHGTA